MLALNFLLNLKIIAECLSIPYRIIIWSPYYGQINLANRIESFALGTSQTIEVHFAIVNDYPIDWWCTTIWPNHLTFWTIIEWALLFQAAKVINTWNKMRQQWRGRFMFSMPKKTFIAICLVVYFFLHQLSVRVIQLCFFSLNRTTRIA